MGRVSFSVVAQGFIFINRTMQVSYVFHLMRYTVRVACAWCTVCIVHCVHCAGFPFSYCVHGVCIVHCVHCAGFFYILAVQVFLFMLCAGFRINVQCYVHVSSSFVVQVFLINFTTLCTFFLFFSGEVEVLWKFVK